MTEGSKRWLIKSAAFGAGFAMVTAFVVIGAGWYIFRSKPQKAPQPWNRMAIRAEFVEPATSDEEGTIRLWYNVTNTTDIDYRIDSPSEVTTAGLTGDGDTLFDFNQGVLFEVPFIVPAHRKAGAILRVPLPGEHLNVPDGASDSAVAIYKKNVMIFLRSKWTGLMGFAVLDERTRYEIDFPLATQIGSETSVKDFLALPDDEKKKVLDKLSPKAKQALLEGIQAHQGTSGRSSTP